MVIHEKFNAPQLSSIERGKGTLTLAKHSCPGCIRYGFVVPVVSLNVSSRIVIEAFLNYLVELGAVIVFNFLMKIISLPFKVVKSFAQPTMMEDVVCLASIQIEGVLKPSGKIKLQFPLADSTKAQKW